MNNIIVEAKNAWEVHADTFGKATDDVRASAVAIITAINAETTQTLKCAARAAIEGRWLATGRIQATSKNKLWARLVAVAFDNGLAMSPFVYPMASEGAKAKASRKAREKSDAMAKHDAKVKAERSAIKAAEDAHSKALGGIRKMITDRARNCVEEITLKRVLAAFDGPAAKRKAPKAK